ncbi:Uncharacterized protein dnm_055950 [Desulfonema magnum]|uniref:Uncharacterized protein n=1 Tax=Desulfonema magnum TaxID=45655 RepID=A0A975BPL6_9BACT|nr:Uncharacterized protein dnm_055950 [Desulfonema magnum]
MPREADLKSHIRFILFIRCHIHGRSLPKIRYNQKVFYTAFFL